AWRARWFRCRISLLSASAEFGNRATSWAISSPRVFDRNSPSVFRFRGFTFLHHCFKFHWGGEEAGMALFLSVLTFLIVICIVMALWISVMGGAKQAIIGQRLEAVRKVEQRGNVSNEVKILRDEMLSTVPAVNRIMMRWSWT